MERDAAARLLSRTTPEIVLALAEYHGVSGMAYEALHTLERIPDSLISELRARYTKAVHHHLLVLWELGRIKPLLDATGPPWAVVKGPAVVERLYSSPGQRPYLDLDLLVMPGSFRAVLDALESAGAQIMDRNWTFLRREMIGEVHLRLPAGTSLDLHWSLINRSRGRMSIDTAEVLQRATAQDLGGVSVRTLEPTDAIIHLALHAALSGGDRLLWLMDLERAARILGPDWQSVVHRARASHVEAPIGFMLARASHVLGAEIPEDVPSALLGTRTARAIRLVERVSPWELSVGRVTAASHIVSRSLGKGWLGASRWAVTRSLRALDPREPAASSAYTDAGGAAGRHAYLDAVASTVRSPRPP